MENGLYEKVIDNMSKKKIANKEYKKTRNVDNSEISRVLSITYQKIIRQTLLRMGSNTERVKFIENLNKTIGIEGFDYEDEKFKELLAIHNEENVFEQLNKYRPKTSISTSTLFTGNSGPTLKSELSREIRTADENNKKELKSLLSIKQKEDNPY
ncbi:hypothetical protein, partial [Schnuerera sp.]|uniref:hypothetical protein n=1 Tax=Schnuerera sp. TaxID=2794844 RepID=UPI002BF92462